MTFGPANQFGGPVAVSGFVIIGLARHNASAMNATTPPKERAVRGRGAKRRIRLPVARTDWSQCDPANLEHPALYINRELSWLEFNQRVLDQALDPAHPLRPRSAGRHVVTSTARRATISATTT